ncbi:MAG: hypothetical protein IPK53_12085 [bacterium]|nr:hypothetical protein [bacterium]
MKANSEIRNLEENVYQQFNKDGALIAGIGFTLLWLGSFTVAWPLLTDKVATLRVPFGWDYVLPILAAAIMGYMLTRIWRHRITFPRLGYSKYIAGRSLPRNMQIRAILLFFLLIFAFGITMSSALKANATELPLTKALEDITRLNGSVTGISMAIAGLILGMRTLLMIVVPMLVLMWLAPFLQISQGWVIALAGVLLIGIGIERLRTFLRENPLQLSTDVQ